VETAPVRSDFGPSGGLSRTDVRHYGSEQADEPGTVDAEYEFDWGMTTFTFPESQS
jgi:hypothetical protein